MSQANKENNKSCFPCPSRQNFHTLVSALLEMCANREIKKCHKYERNITTDNFSPGSPSYKSQVTLDLRLRQRSEYERLYGLVQEVIHHNPLVDETWQPMVGCRIRAIGRAANIHFTRFIFLGLPSFMSTQLAPCM